MNTTKRTGDRGELIAARYLQTHGYRVLFRNVRLRRNEIDLIAYDTLRRMLVFVEVKTRTRTNDHYPIRTAMDRRKRRALRRAIHAWVTSRRYALPVRLDLLCVDGQGQVEHLMDFGAEFFTD